ncbi:MAG TPA: hypothetical protein DD473_26065 [Planctomycetaceae bacterium]|nr:hypothetical protein [Planctomycetaceae bacterium]
MTESENSNHQSARRSLRKIIFFVIVMLLIPILPFVLLGDAFESSLLAGLKATTESGYAGLVLFALLAVDIFLPVPSSGVLTYAGSQIGFLSTVLWATLGLNVGCAIGYEFSRCVGPWVLKRLTSQVDRDVVNVFISRWGGLVILVTRPLPILAEASVLIAGCGKLRRSLFYSLMSVSNLLICIVYAAIGAWFGQNEYFGSIIIASLFLPLAATLLLKRIMQRTHQFKSHDSDV